MHRTSYLAGPVWALLVIATPGTVRAQDHAHGAYDHARSAYAGQADRAIEALSPERVRGLLAGGWMGLAKAAELNGLPGPKHVLDLAEPLVLTPDQIVRYGELRGYAPASPSADAVRPGR